MLYIAERGICALGGGEFCAFKHQKLHGGTESEIMPSIILSKLLSKLEQPDNNLGTSLPLAYAAQHRGTAKAYIHERWCY